MTPERWQQIKGLLAQAMEVDISERSRFVEQICGNDDALRSEVEALLGADADGEFLDQPIAIPESAQIHIEQPATRIGRRIGPYQIVEEIGAGGMGEVYRAFRADDEYQKEVAIKLVRTGQDSRFIVERFKHERQVLAGLDHPNIARLLDGGRTEDGAPYFVMEFVQGVPLTEYCDTHALTTSDRLKLFLQVCSAVQYAHQRLIVHRDLKPSNILVTGEGIPKLLDFGIAKVVDPSAAPQPADATLSMFRLLTPAYASPEQVRGEAITTASDVYSLGVLLYECVTGHRPYGGASTHEVARAVCESEPQKPSTVIRSTQRQISGESTTEITPASVSVVRDGTPEKLGKRLRGDLDNIVLTALRKEPERRYASVEQFATDIKRHLEHLPVIASKDTVQYRTAKFVARHSVGVAGAAALLLVVLAGVAATLHEAHRAKQNELRAEKRFNDVRALANSLLFDIHDSIRDLPGSTPARKLIVQNALQYLDKLSLEAAGDPSLQRELATAYERVGEVQGDFILFNLGDTENALSNYQKALSLRQSITSSKTAQWEDQLALAKSYRLVAAQMRVTGNLPAALQNAQEAISICESLRDAHPDDKQVLAELRTAYDRRGHIQRGSWTQAYAGDAGAALESFGKAMEIDKVLLKLDANNEYFQLVAADEEMFYTQALPSSRNAERLQHYQHVLDIDKKINEHTPSPSHAQAVASVYNRIAMWYDGQRDHIKSEENHRHYVEIIENLYAADPQNVSLKVDVVIGNANLAEELGILGQKNESERLLNRAVTLMRPIAQASPQNTSNQGMLGAALTMRGENFLHWKNFKDGLDDYGAAIDIYRQLLAMNPKNTAAAARLLICRVVVAHTKLGRGDSHAEAELHSALAELGPILADDKVNDETLYAGAAGYADMAKIEVGAARNSATAAQKSHWESAAHWYQSSLSALKRVQNLASQSESRAFGSLDPAVISRRLAICQSAVTRPSDLAPRARSGESFLKLQSSQ